MASDKEYFKELLERLSPLAPVSGRPMMGGTLFYCDGVLIGMVGRNKLFLKQTPTSFRLLPEAELAYPYEESKTLMLVLEKFDDEELLSALLNGMAKDLSDAFLEKNASKGLCQIFQREIPSLDKLHQEYECLTKTLIKRKLCVTCMESCTSGWIASLITDTEGSSAVFRGSFVTYCNEAKIQQGVPEETIRRYGVYSAETARAMAVRCKELMGSDIGIGITGSLGTLDPENQDSLPGEVFIALDLPRKQRTAHVYLSPAASRFEAKSQTAQALIELLKAETTYLH